MDLLPQPITNRWTRTQREFVIFARHAYDITWSELSRIFHVAFAKDLTTLGFTDNNRLSADALSAQHHELRLFRNSAFIKIYEDVDEADLLRVFPQLNEKFVHGAKESNIKIRLRNPEYMDQKLDLEVMLRRIVLDDTTRQDFPQEAPALQEFDQILNYETVTDDEALVGPAIQASYTTGNGDVWPQERLERAGSPPITDPQNPSQSATNARRALRHQRNSVESEHGQH